ncbi:type 1 periplasmic binding fold superfamily protein [Algibacter sp. L4_22]|uniref:type 1 periplasmic binding fold superfamily protein n=1 Tax=Algibacter sp. L4_22 TaxID=2942477 RepID=UPI00201B4DC2|nr:type 1 periplasmic binding fold superfamily protein [Algibacter sp. L4_22]MCL5127919.1 type 1 periplasmic binding fold superfamily protein [Algibacter sp. L4_22]
MKTLKNLSLLFISALVFTACSSDDDNPEAVNEEEVITTLTATLIPAGDGSTITLQTQDLDGDGPNDPVITVSGALAANTIYSGTLELLNETESPAESINAEIEEEDEDHQFFFQVSNDLATFTYEDEDENGNPVGLEFTVTTGDTTGTGTLTITLRHEPSKSGTGVSDGDITNAGGETDIQAIFSISVE